jgi:hypothetical protein
MAVPEKPELPGEAGFGHARNPDPNLSDASLDNVNGGVCAPEGDVPAMDGSNVRPDSPEIGDALDQLKAMRDTMKKIERDI